MYLVPSETGVPEEREQKARSSACKIGSNSMRSGFLGAVGVLLASASVGVSQTPYYYPSYGYQSGYYAPAPQYFNGYGFVPTYGAQQAYYQGPGLANGNPGPGPTGQRRPGGCRCTSTAGSQLSGWFGGSRGSGTCGNAHGACRSSA